MNFAGMTLAQRYELNNPPMIAELVEGEIIAIDLERGSYYSLQGDAARLWEAIVAGYPAEEILGAVNSPARPADLDSGLRRFIEALLAEQLIRPAAGSAASGEPIAALAPWSSESLVFERFTDMQDLLVLDPIHEVDDQAGWPKPSQ
jgi:hypothetical protein